MTQLGDRRNSGLVRDVNGSETGRVFLPVQSGKFAFTLGKLMMDGGDVAESPALRAPHRKSLFRPPFATAVARPASTGGNSLQEFRSTVIPKDFQSRISKAFACDEYAKCSCIRINTDDCIF